MDTVFVRPRPSAIAEHPPEHSGDRSITTLYELIRCRASKTPDAVAVGAPGRPPLSYRGLLAQVERTVQLLRTYGLGRKDRVALVLPNGPEMAVSFLGVAAGATSAPLNPALSANEFDFYMSDVRARALIVWSALDSPARRVAEKLRIPIIEARPAGGAAAGVLEIGGAALEPVPTDGLAGAADTALVLHTSGTTSRPKMVPLTQANIYVSAYHIARTLALRADDCCLNVMPLFHIHGLMAAVLASLTVGSSVVCAPGFDAEKFFQWMDTYWPSWYSAVPTMHQALLARAPGHHDVIARRPLRFIRSSSAPLPRRVLTELEGVFGTQVIEAYGMTEASHQMTSNQLAPLPRKPGSVGVAAGPAVAIMDESGRLLPAGETGEVVIRGPNVTPGYEGDPSANKDAFVDGWFRTGDQGRFDRDGYLFLTGRLKEIINRGGEKIAPKEVDEVLLQHPAVAQVATFAAPHPSLGEDVAAAVVLKEGAQGLERELREFAASRLAQFKVPQQLVFVEEIPKGPTGKPQRIGLANHFAHILAGKLRADFVAPRREVETELSNIWARVLMLDQVGTRDNFYALGGDSLAMAVMLMEVEERFGRTIPVQGFLSCPTVETIATELEKTEAKDPAASAAGSVMAPAIRDSVGRGLRNRLLQWVALYVPGYKTTRVWLHRRRGVSIGANVSIGLSAIIETAYPELVSIGNNVTIGMRAIIIGHLRDSTRGSRTSGEPTVRLEDDVYIGPGVIILPNVTVGQGAVVSAGSVVSKSIPPRTLVRGNPAVPIAHCGVSLAGGVGYEQFVRHLRPLTSAALPTGAAASREGGAAP